MRLRWRKALDHLREALDRAADEASVQRAVIRINELVHKVNYPGDQCPAGAGGGRVAGVGTGPVPAASRLMSTVTDNLAIAAQVKAKGRELGFDLVGIARADTMRFGRYFRRWLDDGRAGEMKYLARRVDERTDPANYLPGAVSAICVAMNYHSSLEPLPEAETARHGRVARYALGDDYHELIKHRLYDLADWLRETVPGAQTRAS
jgi:hypothetical protein